MRARKKLYYSMGLVTLSALLLVFSFQDSLRIFPIDPYWRYQSILLIDQIKSSRDFDSFLLTWGSSFQRDFISPIFIYVLEVVLGKSPKVIYESNILVLIYAMFVGIVSKVYIEEDAFFISIYLITGFIFLQNHYLGTIHRVTFGFLFWLLLIYLFKKYRDNTYYVRYMLLFLIISIAYLGSYSTLVVSSLVFWSVIQVFDFYTREVNRFQMLPFYILILSYSLIIYPWLVNPLLSLSAGLRQLPLIISQGDFLGFLIPSVESSLIYTQNIPAIFDFFGDLARITTVGIALGVFSHRLYHHLSNRANQLPDLSAFDILLVAISVQGVCGLFLQVFFASSGAINPKVLGLTMAPILGSYAVIQMRDCSLNHIFSLRQKQAITIMVVVLLILPGAITLTWQASSFSRFPYSFEEPDQKSFTWSEKYIQGDERILSDFNTISALYFETGSPYRKSYIPRPSEQNSETTGIEGIETLYYHSPSSFKIVSSVYLVSSPMTSDSMFHLNGIATQPNQKLNDRLDHDSESIKVYSSGKNTTIFTSI